MGIENPVHLAFIAIVALIVLGPKRLPELARSLGNGIREFRESVSGEGQHAAPSTVEPVDPAESVRSGDAPDSRPL
jgi:sec-independent protein translocase protein TatA